MPALPESLRAWGSEAFAKTLKSEIEGLPRGALPLDQAVSSHVHDSPITVSVLGAEDGEGVIKAKAGVFFAEILTGCSCGYEPEPQSAYCEISVRIDKANGEAAFSLLS